MCNPWKSIWPPTPLAHGECFQICIARQPREIRKKHPFLTKLGSSPIPGDKSHWIWWDLTSEYTCTGLWCYVSIFNQQSVIPEKKHTHKKTQCGLPQMFLFNFSSSKSQSQAVFLSESQSKSIPWLLGSRHQSFYHVPCIGIIWCPMPPLLNITRTCLEVLGLWVHSTWQPKFTMLLRLRFL